MKKYLLLILIALSCQSEPETNLTGSWWIVEGPEVASRLNRNDTSVPAFDLVFDVVGRDLTGADLWLDGQQVEESFTFSDHESSADYVIQSDTFYLRLSGCKRLGQVMYVGQVDYTLPDGQSKTLKGKSVKAWQN